MKATRTQENEPLVLNKMPENLLLTADTFQAFAFYRAMHFSAKRGIAIACRQSVRLSVRL